MRFNALPALALIAASPALAAPPVADLAVSLAPPSAIHVYQTGRYNLTVANVGNRDAADVSLTIELPETHTSPTVHVMGEVVAMSSSCSLAGTVITCNLGTIRKNRSTSVYFDMLLPQSSAALSFEATGATSSQENNLANNVARHTATPLNYDLLVGPPRDVHNSHCTGTGLTAYFECTLYPSSIGGHDTVFNSDGTITFDPPQPGYTGSWSQANARHLSFQYYENATLVATFTGYGVDGSCFEGVTTFPGSSYVSPYEVCLQ